MTIELVDGHGGKPHISGDDLGDFKAGILGDAGYVFKRANMLAATLNGSNSITIATGSGIMPTSGRHFRVTAPETLAITSGTQGQNRNDLIVVRATTDEESTTVETATLVVLRGTPTSGTATDPATQDGDLPLYRLQLTGVSVAEPIALFDVMVPYSEFRDSISRIVQSGQINIRANSVPANGAISYIVTFLESFESAPTVVCSSEESWFICSPSEVTTTSCRITLRNLSGNARPTQDRTLFWVAVE